MAAQSGEEEDSYDETDYHCLDDDTSVDDDNDYDGDVGDDDDEYSENADDNEGVTGKIMTMTMMTRMMVTHFVDRNPVSFCIQRMGGAHTCPPLNKVHSLFSLLHVIQMLQTYLHTDPPTYIHRKQSLRDMDASFYYILIFQT
jgi:hypothetical protein